MKQMDSVRAVANAVLYEGYMLYPYRPSALKNQRPGWSFGTLLPPAYVAGHPGESAAMSAELLARASCEAEIQVEVRFLQLDKARAAPACGVIERSVTVQTTPATLRDGAHSTYFAFSAGEGSGGEQVEGMLELRAQALGDQVVKIGVTVCNQSAPAAALTTRDEALRYGFIAAHVVAGISGEFVSLLDPPDELRAAVNGCHHTGVFPVLAGEENQRTAMLLSPIILYDYPQIARESPGDFFDSTEIDEMLTLRVLTLSDAEREEISRSSERARQILQRTEATPPEDFLRMHGVFRNTAGKELP